MDEHNDNAYDEVHALVTAVSGGDIALNGYAGQDEISLAPALPARPVQEAQSTTSGKLEAQNFAQRRIHINRFLLMKRRQERFHRSISSSSRVLTLIIVLFAVILSLISSGVGGAYAYYQAQLPLLNGMA